MAKDTLRDRVWKTALRFGSGKVEHDTPQGAFDSHIPDGFTKQELQKAVDASDRVVHDVLKTMTDYGFLSAESQRVYVRQGDSYAIHAATVYSDASESPAGEAGPRVDEGSSTDSDSASDQEDEGYSCNICGDTFETERGKNVHVAQSKDHTPVSDRDECPECGEPFEYAEATGSGLKCDVQVVHQRSVTDTSLGGFPTIEDWCGIYDAEV